LGIFKDHHWHKIIPTRAREVFDVSGAGDTVTASFVLASTAGADAALAAEIANCAAGVVVGKVGTAPIMKEELISAWKGMNK
jgi:D-beta-D-heptose 7-phosphate kinase/D-beta-D-heptose 1-phosphate adenosyltransferase